MNSLDTNPDLNPFSHIGEHIFCGECFLEIKPTEFYVQRYINERKLGDPYHPICINKEKGFCYCCAIVINSGTLRYSIGKTLVCTECVIKDPNGNVFPPDLLPQYTIPDSPPPSPLPSDLSNMDYLDV